MRTRYLPQKLVSKNFCTSKAKEWLYINKKRQIEIRFTSNFFITDVIIGTNTQMLIKGNLSLKLSVSLSTFSQTKLIKKIYET